MGKGRARRQSRKATRQANKSSRKQNKAITKKSRKAEKHEYKLARKGMNKSTQIGRINSRTVKKGFTTEAQKVAYANGIDPKAAMWKGLSDMTSSVSESVVAGFGGAIGKGGKREGNGSEQGDNNYDNTTDDPEKESFLDWFFGLFGM